ncbi:MAG: histidine kinase [Lishizhenia sp.]
MKFWLVYFNLIFLFFSNLCFSQVIPSSQLSEENGLISNSVKKVIKAKNDLIWMATENGVANFNGSIINNYTISDGLPNNNCFSLVEDKYGTIWVGTYGGGVAYFKNGRFFTIDHEDGLISNRCTSFYITDSTLIVGTQHGISTIDINTKKVSGSIAKTDQFQVMDFFEYDNALHFITFKKGAYQINGKDIRKINATKGLFCSKLLDDTLYLGFDGNTSNRNSIGKINVKDFIAGNEKIQLYGKSVIWDFAFFNNSVYSAAWGVNLESGGLFEHTKHQTNISESNFDIPSKSIQSLFLDKRTSTLYVGSVDKGLFIVDLTKTVQRVDELSRIGSKYTIKEDIYCTKLTFANATLELNPSDFFRFLNNFQSQAAGKKRLSETEGYRNFSILEMQTEALFEILSYELHEDFYFLNTSLGIFKIKSTPTQLNIVDYYPVSAFSIYVDHPSRIYFQKPYSDFSILHISPKQELYFTNYTIKDKNNPRDILKIAKLNNTLFAFSRFYGIYKMAENEFSYMNLSQNALPKEIVKTNIIDDRRALLIDNKGNVSLFTVDKNDSTRCKKLINVKGLFGDVIKDASLNQSLLIVVTNLGVNIIELKSAQRYFLDEEHGLPAKNISASKIVNDNVLLFTSNGTYSVDLKDILKEHDCGDIYLKAAFTSEQSLLITAEHEIELGSKQDQLKLQLSSSGMKYPKKLIYRIFIDGNLNSPWSEWKQFNVNKMITIPFVPEGTSKLIMQTKNAFTGSNHEFELATVTKSAPLFKRLWFLLIIFCLAAYIMYILIKKRYKKLYKRQKEKSILEKRLEEAKLEALTSQMSPHFIFNSLNAIQSFVLQNNIEKSIEYISDFSALIRNTLNYSSKKHISLEEEIRYLTLYVKIQNLRFGNSIQFNLSVSKSIDLLDTEIPPLLLQPLLENCFEHAFDTHIKKPEINVHVTEVSGYLAISIKDNGVGFNGINDDNSKGLKLIEERILILNSNNSLELHNREQGTETRLTLQT